MPTTLLATTAGPHKYSVLGKVLTVAAADVANGNHIVATRDMLLFAHNTGASARTITINSYPLPTYAREGDITALSLAAGERRVFRLTDVGWENASGNIEVSANHAEVVLGVVDLTQEVTS